MLSSDVDSSNISENMIIWSGFRMKMLFIVEKRFIATCSCFTWFSPKIGRMCNSVNGFPSCIRRTSLLILNKSSKQWRTAISVERGEKQPSTRILLFFFARLACNAHYVAKIRWNKNAWLTRFRSNVDRGEEKNRKVWKRPLPAQRQKKRLWLVLIRKLYVKPKKHPNSLVLSENFSHVWFIDWEKFFFTFASERIFNFPFALIKCIRNVSQTRKKLVLCAFHCSIRFYFIETMRAVEIDRFFMCDL